MALKHRMFNLEGTRIHAVEEGEGPLVVLIHGFPESWYSWRHQLPALAAAGYKAVAIDKRGYGRSSKFRKQEAYRIGPLVDDIANLIKAYGEESAVVIGHDWGAPIAWTFAWTRPEMCRGVVGISVPFAGRGLVGYPGSPFGEVRPKDYYKVLAGPGKTFYKAYFSAQDAIIREVEEDLRGWLLGLMYTVSGDAGALMPPPPAEMTPLEMIQNSPVAIPDGARMSDAFVVPEKMPAWLSEADLDFYVGEFERSGFSGPLSYYHNMDASWSDLAAQADKPLTPPSLFIGGQYDVGTLWGMEAIERAEERMTDLRGKTILEGSGHWVQQEKPEQTNALILDFLAGLD